VSGCRHQMHRQAGGGSENAKIPPPPHTWHGAWACMQPPLQLAPHPRRPRGGSMWHRHRHALGGQGRGPELLLADSCCAGWGPAACVGARACRWTQKGAGAEGEVFMAKSRTNHEVVALKLRKRGGRVQGARTTGRGLCGGEGAAGQAGSRCARGAAGPCRPPARPDTCPLPRPAAPHRPGRSVPSKQAPADEAPDLPARRPEPHLHRPPHRRAADEAACGARDGEPAPDAMPAAAPAAGGCWRVVSHRCMP
jgi:hypothetical protein